MLIEIIRVGWRKMQRSSGIMRLGRPHEDSYPAYTHSVLSVAGDDSLRNWAPVSRDLQALMSTKGRSVPALEGSNQYAARCMFYSFPQHAMKRPRARLLTPFANNHSPSTWRPPTSCGNFVVASPSTGPKPAHRDSVCLDECRQAVVLVTLSALALLTSWWRAIQRADS
jgi:hypothetical protein